MLNAPCFGCESAGCVERCEPVRMVTPGPETRYRWARNSNRIEPTVLCNSVFYC